MKIGLIGVGTVGGTLKQWFINSTQHEIAYYDPPKGLTDNLKNCDAIFISIPVVAARGGQEISDLEKLTLRAKHYTNNVFIRSTVLPGTNDKLGTIAMPEFLTERRAYQDFCELPILLGESANNPTLSLNELFPGKTLLFMSNTEAELSKFTHNCFGAMKVTYFNIIKTLCDKFGADFGSVKQGAFMTGFIESGHTLVPGPDGQNGYGGKCFPENIRAMKSFLASQGMNMEHAAMFFQVIHTLNLQFRHQQPPQLESMEA